MVCTHRVDVHRHAALRRRLTSCRGALVLHQRGGELNQARLLEMTTQVSYGNKLTIPFQFQISNGESLLKKKEMHSTNRLIRSYILNAFSDYIWESSHA